MSLYQILPLPPPALILSTSSSRLGRKAAIKRLPTLPCPELWPLLRSMLDPTPQTIVRQVIV